MTSARARFRAWKKWTGATDVEIARRLGCDPSYPGKLAKTKTARRPGLKVASAIERESEAWPGGPIRVSEWVPTAVAAPSRSAA
jgi:hypothetical protein